MLKLMFVMSTFSIQATLLPRLRWRPPQITAYKHQQVLEVFHDLEVNLGHFTTRGGMSAVKFTGQELRSCRNSYKVLCNTAATNPAVTIIQYLAVMRAGGWTRLKSDFRKDVGSACKSQRCAYKSVILHLCTSAARGPTAYSSRPILFRLGLQAPHQHQDGFLQPHVPCQHGSGPVRLVSLRHHETV